MKKERWAVRRGFFFSWLYVAAGHSYQWSRRLEKIHWYKSRAEAERSFNHSMYEVVRESDVLADLTAEALTGGDPDGVEVSGGA